MAANRRLKLDNEDLLLILRVFHGTLQAVPLVWSPEDHIVLQDCHGRPLGAGTVQSQLEDEAYKARQYMIEAALALCEGSGKTLGGKTNCGVYFLRQAVEDLCEERRKWRRPEADPDQSPSAEASDTGTAPPPDFWRRREVVSFVLVEIPWYWYSEFHMKRWAHAEADRLCRERGL